MLEPLHLTEGERAADSPGLSGFARALDAAAAGEHVAAVAADSHPARILGRDERAGAWVTGRYAGRLALDGQELVLNPRMGWDHLGAWVAAASDLAVPAGAERGPAAVDVLCGLLWVRAVDGASRHGPPAFRRDVPHSGADVRGRLDVRATVRLRARGDSGAASVYRARELDNPVTRIIVAADRVLNRQIGGARWRTDRVDEILPQLHSAVGRRFQMPAPGELRRMRYTPITRPFKWAAELSSRIVRQDPLLSTPRPGRVQGLVVDLESVWTAAVLAWTREARSDLRAEMLDHRKIAVRDRHSVRARLFLDRSTTQEGGPRVTLLSPGRPPADLALPADRAEAGALVREALAAV